MEDFGGGGDGRMNCKKRGDSDEVIVVDKGFSRFGRKAIQVRPCLGEELTKSIVFEWMWSAS